MKIKLNIYQKEKNRALKKNILIFLLVSISVMAVMTFFFSILYPEESKLDFLIATVGVWILLTIFCFSANRYRWGNPADRCSADRCSTLRDILTAVVCLVISLLFSAFFTYRGSIVSEEGKNAIQEAASYDALQNCETEDYRMVVLDRDAWEKDVRYYSKKYHHYLYYHVKPDLSVEEVPVSETVFLPDQYKGE